MPRRAPLPAPRDDASSSGHDLRLVALRILLGGAVAFAVTMALLPRPPVVAIGDKWQHMAAFGVLTILAAAAFPAAPVLRIGERLSFLGAMIEVAQSIPALHRDCDIMDWVADTAIVIAVLLVVHRCRRGG